MKKRVLFEAILSLLLVILLFATYLMVATGGPSIIEKWAASGVTASPDNMAYGNVFYCDNGVLYTVDGKSIHALDSNGSALWSYGIPGGQGNWIGVKAATDDKSDLYIIVSPDHGANGHYDNARLLAISPVGKLLWDRDLSHYYPYMDLDVKTHGDRLYFFTGHDVYIWDPDGNEVKWIDDVYTPPSMDRNGTLYLFPGRVGSSIVEAYGADGTLLWNNSFSEYGVDNIDFPLGGIKQPLLGAAARSSCNNTTLYLGLVHSELALNTDGSLEWKKSFGAAYINNTWFDPNGDVYLSLTNLNGPHGDQVPSIHVIHPDGDEDVIDGGANFGALLNAVTISDGVAYGVNLVGVRGSLPWPYGCYESHATYEEDLERLYASDNQTYSAGPVMPKPDRLPNGRDINALDTYNISAYDVKTGALLWSNVVPLSPRHTVLSASSVNSLILFTDGIVKDNGVTPSEWYRSRGIPEGAKVIGSYSWINLLPAKNLLYVNFWSYNYEIPTFYNESRCVYSGGIYALNKDGRLAWDQSTTSRVTYLEEKNGTVYFGTGDGRVSATTVNVAAGAALLAAVYLFIRFFLVGAVSRARDRLDKNDNRNKVLRFIGQNPGATMYDVARGVGMNLGTVRYHLLILTVNHRVVAYKTDLKYIRYFTNSGSYSGEEQLAMSLVRRDGVRKILGMLIEKPGLSHTQLSEALGMPESSLSRYMKELYELGIVDKATTGNGMNAYSIKSEHRQAIASMMERV